jgi:membrane protein
MNRSVAWEIFKRTISEWIADDVPSLGAALAYYAVFSIAPLLLISIALASEIFGQEAARGHVTEQLRNLIGIPAAQAIEDLLRYAHASGGSIIATAIGAGVLLFGASGVFLQLQGALNKIWKVQAKSGRGVVGVIYDRIFSFAVVAGAGILLLASLIANAVLSGVEQVVPPDAVPGSAYLWQALNNLISFLFITLIFALIYKILPDAFVGWKDVWVGAPLTALLFTAGKYGIGLYLGWSSTTSAFGAAGSLVVILVWVYYSSQILLFGAEFTRVYSEHNGSTIVPKGNAELCRR